MKKCTNGKGGHGTISSERANEKGESNNIVEAVDRKKVSRIRGTYEK